MCLKQFPSMKLLEDLMVLYQNYTKIKYDLIKPMEQIHTK